MTVSKGKLGSRWVLAASMLVAMSVSRVALTQETRPAKSVTTRIDPAAEMADRAMMTPMDTNNMKHMRLSPRRSGTSADTARALALVKELRAGIARYQDTAVAVADGFRMFAPGMKQQHVYHFTNYLNALEEAFRFDATRPTSLLYERQPDGRLKLIGAMYTMPRRSSLDQLDARVPLSVATWHQHVNWCVPRRGEAQRWTETSGGLPVFGPESPVATREACDKVGGQFAPTLFGWMLHANVFAGDDLSRIFADHDDHSHAGH